MYFHALICVYSSINSHLMQALSNDIYKSITHRVVANQDVERYSAAYFYCPTYETVIQSCSNPSLYRNFSFKEYRVQTEKDVKATGNKVGLSRFLLWRENSLSPCFVSCCHDSLATVRSYSSWRLWNNCTLKFSWDFNC